MSEQPKDVPQELKQADQEDETAQDYFFPILLLRPEFEEDELSHGRFGIVKRLSEVTSSDLGVLTLWHNLHLPQQMMELFLQDCHMEIRVSGAKSLEEAKRAFAAFRVSSYAVHCSPFTNPYICTHPTKNYSRLGGLDGPYGTMTFNDGPGRNWLNGTYGILEAWPMELQFEYVTYGQVAITDGLFRQAAEGAEAWLEITGREKGKNKPVAAFEQAAITAPSVRPISQSFLHLWSGLEGLFPTMSGEGLTFKLALYLSQMNAKIRGEKRLAYMNHAKKQYGVRSRIAHGSLREITIEQWSESWKLMIDSLEAIIKNGGLPTEEKLLEALLADPVAVE